MIGMLWRQFNQERWPALILALSVAVLAAVAGVVPRLMSDLDDRQLTQELAGLSTVQGDVTGSWAFDPYNSPIPVVDEGDPWAAHREAAIAVRDSQPEPLRSLLTEPQFIGRLTPDVSVTPPLETGYYGATFQVLVDPQLTDHVELVEGAWPQVVDGQRQVAVLDEVARRLQWQLGQEVANGLFVVGTFRPIDATDRRWEHVPTGRAPFEAVDPNRGTELRSGLFLPPDYSLVDDLGGPLVDYGTSMTRQVWFGLDPAALRSTGVDVAELSGQLTALLARRHEITPAVEGGAPALEIRLSTELGTALDRVRRQQATTRSVLAVAAVGPIAVGAALVLLAARLVVERRRPWLELTNARGLAPEQGRRLAAVEGAVLSVPAAAIGQLAAQALIPGPKPALAWLGAVLVAAVAPIAMAIGVGRVGTRRSRTDLSPKAGRWRVVGELLAIAAAAAATWQLLTRADDDAQGGIDLLGAAAPVLWTLAVALLVLRFYPVPLALLARWLKRRPGLTGFLGAVRSLRDPAGGVMPIVTVLLGATLAVLGATLLSTLTTGTERATWESTGSHIHLSGPRMTDPLIEELRAIDGVAHVARIYEGTDNARLTHAGGEERVRVLLADPEILDVYAPTPGGSPLPASVFGGRDAVASEDLPSGLSDVELDGVGEVNVAARLRTIPGSGVTGSWLLIDRANWPLDLRPASIALISVEPGADMRGVAEAIASAVPNSRVADVDSQLNELRASPTVEGLSRAFLILAGTTAALMALGVVGSQLLAGGERNHLAAVLRTLGMRPGQVRSLTAWEVGPAIVLALAVGVALGVGMAALMLHSLDFRSLTGGAHAPELTLHWPTLGAVIGALVATMAIAVGATSWIAGRTDVAQELRIGDQR